jgi:hypothetical protein
MVVGSTNGGGGNGVLRTMTMAASGASSSVVAALFLAVAYVKRTDGGDTGKSDRTQSAKVKTSHAGTRLAVEGLASP